MVEARHPAIRRSRALCSVLFVGAFSAAGVVTVSGTAEAQLPVDALVAVVGAETPSSGTDEVLLSDVELRARLELASVGETPRGPLELSLLSATLEEIVGEILVAREAERLRQPAPSDEAVEAQRSRLVLSVGGETAMSALLASTGASAAELVEIARRRAVVEAFFRANLEGNTTISDAELTAVYATSEHPFVGRPLEEIREPLRAWLAMAALRRDVARWLEVLSSRTVVRIAVLPAPSDDEGER